MRNTYILKKIIHYLKPHWFRFVTALVCMCVVASLTAFAMWLVKFVVDKIFIIGDPDMLMTLVILIPLVYLVKDALTYVQNYLMAFIGQKTIQTVRDELFSHLVYMDLEYFRSNTTGLLMQKITNDTQVLQNALVKIPASLIRDGLTLALLVGLVFYMHWKFALILLLVFPVSITAIVNLGKKMRRAGGDSQKSMADVYNNLEESFTGNTVIKVFSREEDEISRFKKKNQNYFNNFMRYTRADVLSNPLMEFIGALAITFIIWYGGRDVIRGVWTTGSFFAFLASAVSAYKPLKSFSQINAVIQLAFTGAERIFGILDTKPKITDKPGARDFGRFSGSIAFRDVNFSYSSGKNVLSNVNFKIDYGQIVAIVGPSGAGKTTLVNLLVRYFDPDKGVINMDGRDIRDWKLSSLRDQIGFVSQDVILFNDTVEYNIGYAGKNVSRSEIIEAAKMSHADEFIRQMPDGYDSIIGEKGCALSGGQRQRLAIARAILKNPAILILDEATSALDSESEKYVQDALEKLMQKRTVIVIAHRLSTIKKSDRIILMEKGRIVKEGSHETLLKDSPLYKKLYDLQFSV